MSDGNDPRPVEVRIAIGMGSQHQARNPHNDGIDKRLKKNTKALTSSITFHDCDAWSFNFT